MVWAIMSHTSGNFRDTLDAAMRLAEIGNEWI